MLHSDGRINVGVDNDRFVFTWRRGPHVVTHQWSKRATFEVPSEQPVLRFELGTSDSKVKIIPLHKSAEESPPSLHSSPFWREETRVWPVHNPVPLNRPAYIPQKKYLSIQIAAWILSWHPDLHLKCQVPLPNQFWDSNLGPPIPKQKWYHYTKGSDPEVRNNQLRYYTLVTPGYTFT